MSLRHDELDIALELLPKRPLDSRKDGLVRPLVRGRAVSCKSMRVARSCMTNLLKHLDATVVQLS